MRSKDGESLLKLVGTLQNQGLAINNLGWRVSADTARKARSDATKIALGNLRSRAEEAASIVGLRFASFQEIRLDGSHPSPAPRAMMMAAGTSPHAEAEDATIEATVEADVLLQPAKP